MQRLGGRPRRQRPARAAAARPAQNAGWAQLPTPLLHACFALLPLDARLLAAGVCAGWRAAAAAQDWTRLSFHGCAATTNNMKRNQLFLAAARRAGNAAVALELAMSEDEYTRHISRRVLLEVLRANGATLREVSLGDELYSEMELAEFVKAVPHAHVFAAQADLCSQPLALPMLRNEPPFAALRLHKVGLYHDVFAADLHTLMSAVAAHTSLRTLKVNSFFTAAAEINAVVDAAVSLGLCELTIETRAFVLPTAAALPRLLQSEALTALTIKNGFLDSEDYPQVRMSLASAVALAAALRTNSTLTALSIERLRLWETDAADSLLVALTSHPSLRSISFDNNEVPAATAVKIGAALGVLIAADAPALESLQLYNCQLGDAGMAPVVAALPRNTHLRVLDIDRSSMSVPFARAHLLPALQACTSVHTIHGRHGCRDSCISEFMPGLGQELEQLLSPRRPAEAAR